MMACNKTYEEIRPGDEATLTRVCTGNDLFIFAHASGNLNPLHLPHTDTDGVDGPLAMDNAIDIEAARTKGVSSLVAGRAEVLVAPNMESGNMLAKELSFVAHAECAGLVLGGQVPVILTSRADSDQSRLDSCAVAVLYQHWRNTGRPAKSARAMEVA